MAENSNEKLPITAYSILPSLMILWTLVLLIGTIIIQSTFGYSEETGYSFPQTIGIVYSAAAIPLVCMSNGYDASLMSATSAIVAVCIGLLMIILASYLARGKNWALWSLLGLTAADTVCLIPLLILSASGNYEISLRVQDIILQILMHALMLANMIIVIVMKLKMNKAGEIKVHD